MDDVPSFDSISLPPMTKKMVCWSLVAILDVCCDRRTCDGNVVELTLLKALAASKRRTASDCFLPKSSFIACITASLPASRPHICNFKKASTIFLVMLITIFPFFAVAVVQGLRRGPCSLTFLKVSVTATDIMCILSSVHNS